MIPKGYSKAVGIRRLMEYFNERNGDSVSMDDTYAYGDSMNDFEMLNGYGNSVAMGNADARVKAVAGFVTKSNDADGISYALKELFKVI